MSEISLKFKLEVQLHLLKNYLISTKESSPLILGIDGPPGEGKTYQCNEVLKQLHCNVVSLSATDFGSQYEGNASNYIVKKYREAGQKNLPVLVLNDIDTAIGEWGQYTQYTANRQFVINELMHICDFPECPHDIKSNRVPIIMTGNDFNRMYAPLIRFGRMKHFEWCPDENEKLKIITNILYPLPMDVCEKIIQTANEEYQNIAKKSKLKNFNRSLPVSFYSQLKTTLVDKFLSIQIEKRGWYNTYSDYSNNGDGDLFIQLFDSDNIDTVTVFKVAKQLAETAILQPHI